MQIAIAKLRLDGGTQHRPLDDAALEEYESLFRDGSKCPPVSVIHDDGTYWLYDGFHRVEAARRAGLDDIEADVQGGGRRDAVFLSFGANAGHGVRRRPGEVAAIVRALLADPEWGAMSQGRIAKAVKCSQGTVSRVLSDSTHARMSRGPVVGLDGREYSTENIGRPVDRLGNRLDALTGKRADNVRRVFAEAGTIDGLVRDLGRIKTKVLSQHQAGDRLYAALNEKMWIADTANALAALTGTRPYAVCPRCNAGGCDGGADRGWGTRLTYEAMQKAMTDSCAHESR